MFYNFTSMDTIIENFKAGEEYEISELIRNVYDKFVASDYTKEGNDFFYNFIKPEKILDRFLMKIDAVLVAKNNKLITGVLTIKNLSHISLLFVHNDYHSRGIAKKLLSEYITRIDGKGLNAITVYSSPYSQNIYKKLGFIPYSEMLEAKGIKYFPMKLVLSNISQ